MAKADLRKAETERFREQIAWVVLEVTRHLQLKEIVALIHGATGEEKDERQIARWQNGQERPQFELLWAVPSLQIPIVLAFAKLAGQQVDITTQISIRRIV